MKESIARMLIEGSIDLIKYLATRPWRAAREQRAKEEEDAARARVWSAAQERAKAAAEARRRGQA